MEFVDRVEEIRRLEELSRNVHGGLAVVWGRRRVGKTRLLLEWADRHDGLYTVADQSAPTIQREFLAQAVSRRFPGFETVVYPDWRSLLTRLASEAVRARWAGPIIFDEFPYLAAGDPSLPSVFQNWIDHEVSRARVSVALAGSSQRMMQGLVLDPAAPLYGRAQVHLEVRPLLAGHIRSALGLPTAAGAVVAYSIWGGIPRYWELAEPFGHRSDEAVERCVLDPLSPLFHEPERLLLEETPPAMALRPILDLIGAGVHKVSELAGRLNAPATSLSRPLSRLVELGLVTRDTPYGDAERSGKRSRYRISDPFFRLWFRLVAPNKAVLTQAPPEIRAVLWRRHRSTLVAETWEELCRRCVPVLDRESGPLGALGPWEPAKRYWRGSSPEWDIVSRSLDGQRLLLGEARWSWGRLGAAELQRGFHDLVRKGVPPVPGGAPGRIVHAVFAPEAPETAAHGRPFCVVDAETVLSCLR